ncbi:MAG: beta-CASP ribonuclease aCPSF1, partial [Candidatus Thermoplasmatota archaeon]|nr:beta-CASP ribonuclease aCPSF1 [Candidatus Thermoplasmatota archaeon]
MSAESVLKKAMEIIKETTSPEVDISEVEFEGPVLVIYTKTLDAFSDNNETVRKLAQALKRRVAVRPHESLLIPVEEAENIIKGLVPEEAELTGLFFDDDTGEVTLEAISPGSAVGKQMSVLNDIKKQTGWAPKVVRSPPIPSKTLG